jgi:hypothetical protein
MLSNSINFDVRYSGGATPKRTHSRREFDPHQKKRKERFQKWYALFGIVIICCNYYHTTNNNLSQSGYVNKNPAKISHFVSLCKEKNRQTTAVLARKKSSKLHFLLLSTSLSLSFSSHMRSFVYSFTYSLTKHALNRTNTHILLLSEFHVWGHFLADAARIKREKSQQKRETSHEQKKHKKLSTKGNFSIPLI